MGFIGRLCIEIEISFNMFILILFSVSSSTTNRINLFLWDQQVNHIRFNQFPEI